MVGTFALLILVAVSRHPRQFRQFYDVSLSEAHYSSHGKFCTGSYRYRTVLAQLCSQSQHAFYNLGNYGTL